MFGNCLVAHSKIKKMEMDIINLLYDSCEKYKKAYEINSKDYILLFDWGNALLNLSKFNENLILTKYYQSTNEILLNACKRYELSHQLKIDFFPVLYNWIIALSKLTRLIFLKFIIIIIIRRMIFIDEKEVQNFFQKAFLIYQIASELQEHHELYFNYANLLFYQTVFC